MSTCRFAPGDRIVYTAWGAPYEGIGGTVIKVHKLPNASGVFGGPSYYLQVILDTAEVVQDEDSVFQFEGDYDPEIPF